jgi:hypothetical protein
MYRRVTAVTLECQALGADLCPQDFVCSQLNLTNIPYYLKEALKGQGLDITYLKMVQWYMHVLG